MTHGEGDDIKPQRKGFGSATPTDIHTNCVECQLRVPLSQQNKIVAPILSWQHTYVYTYIKVNSHYICFLEWNLNDLWNVFELIYIHYGF